MKKIITLITSLLLAVACVFGLTACAPTEKIVDVTPKSVTVGYTVVDPMNYTDDEGVFTGFDTELALRVFNALGYEVMFKEIDWNNKYVELNSGTVDCVWNGFTMNSTDEDEEGNVVARDTLCDFSLKYMENGQCLFTKTANAITSLSQLANKSVVYEGGSAADSLVNGEMFEGINCVKTSVKYQNNACQEVLNGTKDYAVVDVILAKQLIKNNPDYADCMICDIDLGLEYYAIGFKKGSQLTAKVNAMLEAYAKIGYLTELATKYGLENAVITSWGE